MTATNKFFLSLAFASLASCKAYDIKPGSERIRVFEAEPKGCIFLGEIPAEQEDKVMGPAPANMEMTLATRVEMRNKAYALNGNVIVFANKNKAVANASAADSKKAAAATPAATSAAGASSPTPSAEPEERKIKTVFLATVFRCPPNIVNQ